MFDKYIEEYLNKLIGECYSSLSPEMQNEESRQKLEEVFQQVIFDSLIDNLDEASLRELSAMDLSSEEAQDKILILSSQIPNFASILEKKLEEKATQIKNTHTIL